MRVERLFNVLVLGGAALAGACGNSAPDDDGKSSQAGAGGVGTGGGNTAGTGGATSGAGGSDAGSAGLAAGSSNGGGSGGTAVELECMLDTLGRGDPADPCGCPCCWVIDCSNDEDCCGSFCAAGDDGRGCCGQ